MTTTRYLRGTSAAAKYLGVNRCTLRLWLADKTLAGRELLAPARHIKGAGYYDTGKLDRFMQARAA